MVGLVFPFQQLRRRKGRRGTSTEATSRILYRFTPGIAPAWTCISPPAPDGHGDCFDTAPSWPSPSPDDTRIADEDDRMRV